MLAENIRDKYRKYRKNNKSKKNQDLETEEAKKDPEMSANIAKIAKVTRIFLLAKNTRDKYRKNKKSNKNQDVETEEAKKGPEMSANIPWSQRFFLIFLRERDQEKVAKATSLLAEVSHDEAKMRERRETSAGFRRVCYHACAGVSLTTSDVFSHVRHNPQNRFARETSAEGGGICCGEFFAM